MSYILINDIFDELREENKLIYDLLDKYRNFSLNLQNICICVQKSNDFVFKALEEEYQKFLNQKIIKSIKSETIEKSLEKTSEDKNTDESECEVKGFNKRLKTTLSLETHKKRPNVQQIEETTCDYPGCGKTFRYALCAQKHKQQFHQDHEGASISSTNRIICEWPGCGKTYKTLKCYRNHKFTHTMEKQIPCKVKGCPKICCSVAQFHAHMVCHKRKFKCSWPGCEAGFIERNVLIGHINREHKNIRPFKCTLEGCLKAFDSLRNLKSHKKLKHLTKKDLTKKPDPIREPVVYKCRECCFETNYENLLKGHFTKKHSKQEPTVKCTHEGCDKLFISKRFMRSHISKVHNNKKLHCDWPGCDFSTTTGQRTIDDHKRYHIGSKDFKCDFEGCHKSFVTKNCWRQHRLIHLKRFVCSWPECGQRFSGEKYLTAHMNTHLNLRPFKCSFNDCNKDYKIYKHLKQHIRTAHNSQTNSI